MLDALDKVWRTEEIKLTTKAQSNSLLRDSELGL